MSDAPSWAALTQERDQLLAEKEAWKKPPEAPEAKAAQESWEAEKAELVKGRDEAMTQAKVQLVVADPAETPLMLP
jgi:hypothetical protein